MSSMASAKSRFSRVFAASNVLTRLALETSNPPNLAIHWKILASLTPCFSARIGNRYASLVWSP
jgi:hypothetical protein